MYAHDIHTGPYKQLIHLQALEAILDLHLQECSACRLGISCVNGERMMERVRGAKSKLKDESK